MLASSILDHMIVPEPRSEVEPANGLHTNSQEGKAQETLDLQQQVQAGNAEAGGALPQVCMGNWNLASPNFFKKSTALTMQGSGAFLL